MSRTDAPPGDSIMFLLHVAKFIYGGFVNSRILHARGVGVKYDRKGKVRGCAACARLERGRYSESNHYAGERGKGKGK